jgi:hypothetical protein
MDDLWLWAVALVIIAIFYYDHLDSAEHEKTNRTIIAGCTTQPHPEVCIATWQSNLRGEK